MRAARLGKSNHVEGDNYDDCFVVVGTLMWFTVSFVVYVVSNSAN